MTCVFFFLVDNQDIALNEKNNFFTKRKLLANYIDQYQIKVYNAILAENINPEGENKFNEILSIS